MLQVPCLSPPIYGRSHYKKFWLRQNSEKDPSGGIVSSSSSGDHMKSSGAATAAAAATGARSSGPVDGSKRICGKRRPQLRCCTSSTSSIKAAAVDRGQASPTSSSGDLDTNGSWKRSSLSSSTVVDGDGEEATPTPKSHLFFPGGAAAAAEVAAAAAADADREEKYGLSLPEVVARVSEADLAVGAAAAAEEEEEEEEEIEEIEEEEKMVVRQNMVSFDDRSEQGVVCLAKPGVVAVGDHDHDDDGDDDHGQRSRRDPAPDTISNSSASAADSDSTTSSTSQASDDHDDDARSKSSSLRQYMKRHPKASGEIDQLLLGSPRTRLASAAASGGGGVDNPVSSPSGRSGSSSRGDGLLGSPSVTAANNNVSTRTCKHCGTMKTPLWRNGPLGPKSLCNACGIRLRKARRNANGSSNPDSPSAAAAAAAGTPSGKRKLADAAAAAKVAGGGDVRHPYKKSRLAFAREKRQQMGSMVRLLPLEQQQQLLSSSSKRSVPKDEEEGAFLLMALSCGLILA